MARERETKSQGVKERREGSDDEPRKELRLEQVVVLSIQFDKCTMWRMRAKTLLKVGCELDLTLGIGEGFGICEVQRLRPYRDRMQSGESNRAMGSSLVRKQAGLTFKSLLSATATSNY